MADLSSYEEVVQLSETLEYPDGYNCVEIIGEGDVRKIAVFPSIEITGPLSITSDGKQVATITVTITDTNSADPFYLEPNQVETVTPSTPQDLSVGNWITTLHGVWEDSSKIERVPSKYISYKENTIHISDEWRASNAPAPPNDWSGFYSQTAYVEYDGQYTLSVEDGLQVVDRWWARPGDDERVTEKDVSGQIYIDALATQVCTSSEIGIWPVRGQTTTVTFYYRPDAGEYGYAYINVEWGGATAIWIINVKCGSYDGASISLAADPSSIAPGTGSKVTMTATDKNGGPITRAIANFYIQAGNGYLKDCVAAMDEIKGEVEEIESSSTTTVGVGHPIIRIVDIDVIGDPTFIWNGRAVISGSSLTLVDQKFHETNAVSPLRITYDWGGQASTYYHAVGDRVGSKVYIGGYLVPGQNALCTIDITEAGSSGEGVIDIAAEDSSIAQGASTIVTCICRDANGRPVTMGINYELIPRKGTLSMSTESLAIVDEEGSISTTKTVTVNYDIASVSSVKFLGTSYAVASVLGNEITISGSFPVNSGTALVSYTTGAMSRGTYTAADADYTVYITATKASLNLMDTCSIDVGSGGGAGSNFSISLEATPSSLPAGSRSTITATVRSGDTLVEGASVSFSNSGSTGVLSAEGASTDNEGKAVVTIYSARSGNTTVTGTYKDISSTASVTWEPKKDTDKTVVPITLPPITITGWADPATKTYLLTNGAVITDWGIAASADEHGCTNSDPSNVRFDDGMLMIKNTDTGDALPWAILSATVTGGIWEMDMMQKSNPDFLATVDVGIQWPFEPNAGYRQILQVVDKTDETVGIADASVTIAGQTVRTDTSGVATFIQLPEGQHSVYITHPNYKDNRVGVPGGTGVYDSDTTNDTYTVGNYSTAAWKLKRVEINITITYTVAYTGYQGV